ncbi:MAG: hypothetical protein PHE79_08700 [Eubacteriales bacterium]|nr:hypothetical protein [Eubacteriales bacterium]
MNDIFIQEIRMPYKVRAMIMLDRENDDYVIYVNDYLSEEARLRAIEHEREHIGKGHLYSELSLVEIERSMK